jgi:hypothetical protein
MEFLWDEDGGVKQIARQTKLAAPATAPDGAQFIHTKTRNSAGRDVALTFGSHVSLRYEHDELGRRQSVTPVDPASLAATPATPPGWSWTYDNWSQVTGAARFNSSGPLEPLARGYDYDPIGNRSSATRGIGPGARSTGYSATPLNQYETITHPRKRCQAFSD